MTVATALVLIPAISVALSASLLERNLDVENLLVQTDVRDYSFIMLCLTAVQLVLGVVGTFAVLYSLALSRTATKAAIQSVELTQLMSHRELRAYLMLEESQTLIENGHGLIILTFKNSGLTPAIDAVIDCGLASRPTGGPINLIPLPFKEPMSRYTVPAGGVRQKPVGLDLAITPHHVHAMRMGEIELIIYGEARYYDIFGRLHWSRFQACTGGSFGYTNGASLFLMGEGNEEDWDFSRSTLSNSSSTSRKQD